MIWFVLLFVVALLIIFYWHSKKKGSSLLEVNICTENASDYYVNFKLNHADFKQEEYIRMILCFAAKMLYIFDIKQSDIKNEMLEGIKQLSEADLNNTEDIAFYCQQYVDIKEDNTAKPGKVISALLFVNKDIYRHVQTTIPATWFEYQFYHSFLALVQTSLPKLDDDLIKCLSFSLKEMVNFYFNENYDPADMNSLHQVPNLAFLKSIERLQALNKIREKQVDNKNGFPERRKFSTCAKCSNETSKSGNYTNMVLLGISNPEEFDNHYGMMCAKHAGEMTNKILTDKNLTESDLMNANKIAMEIMNNDFYKRYIGNK